MLSVITAISFSLYFTRTFTCIIQDLVVKTLSGHDFMIKNQLSDIKKTFVCRHLVIDVEYETMLVEHTSCYNIGPVGVYIVTLTEINQSVRTNLIPSLS